MVLREGVLLAPYTTFHIGGPAKVYIEITSREEVESALKAAKEHGLPLALLGGGSNILVPDEGLHAAVLHLNARQVSFKERGDTIICTADSGAAWDDLVLAAVAQGLWGVENLSGIPGSVGGAVVQNIGAYGAVLSAVLESVEVYDIEQGVIRTMHSAECAFDYRTSIFKRSPGRYLILAAQLRLSKTPEPNLSYKDLHERFSAEPNRSLAQVREAVLAIRAGKFPDLSRYGTAGSFFLNPVVHKEEAEKIAERYPGMPLFSMPEGGVKVPVAWILDYRHGVLDLRELKVGGAFLWPAQPLVIATERGASAHDVEKLAEEVAARVKEKTGIELSRELASLL